MTASVPNNPLGIVAGFLTNNPTFTNPKYRTKKKLILHSTATPGAPAKNFISAWNKPNAGASVEFVLDDKSIIQLLPIGKNGENCVKSWNAGSGKKGSANNTHIAVEMCEPIQTALITDNFKEQSMESHSNKFYVVSRLQMELKFIGAYNDEVDGCFGPATKDAVTAYQKSHNLKVTGTLNRPTWKSLKIRQDSFLRYDVVGATDFFNKTYDNAVHLFAWLCDYVGAKPSEIICHCEAYQMGIGSNHADVNHWLPLHKKTMDQFRADVKNARVGAYRDLKITSPTPDHFIADVNAVAKAKITTIPDYWISQRQATSVDPVHVDILLRDAAIYYCNRNYLYAVDVMVKGIGLNSPDYWKSGGPYTTGNVMKLIEKCAIALALLSQKEYADTECTHEQFVRDLTYAGVINTPDFWLNITSRDIVDPKCVKSFIRQMSDVLCRKSPTLELPVIVLQAAINMNSPAYWMGGKYNGSNIKALFAAIAKYL